MLLLKCPARPGPKRLPCPTCSELSPIHQKSGPEGLITTNTLALVNENRPWLGQIVQELLQLKEVQSVRIVRMEARLLAISKAKPSVKPEEATERDVASIIRTLERYLKAPN